jgi:hypothetical protein
MYVRRQAAMGTKLTLRLEDAVIKNAKKAARTKGISLSRMVSDYFKAISSQRKRDMFESPVLAELSGILSTKSDEKKLFKTYKKHLEEKYR